MGWTDLVVPESLHLLLIGCLSHLEDQWGLTKPEILRGDVTIQEDVDPWSHTKNQGETVVIDFSIEF